VSLYPAHLLMRVMATWDGSVVTAGARRGRREESAAVAACIMDARVSAGPRGVWNQGATNTMSTQGASEMQAAGRQPCTREHRLQATSQR